MLRVVRTMDDALALREWLHRQPVTALDTETSGMDTYAPNFEVRLIQFGNKTEAWVLPFEEWRGFCGELIERYDGAFLIHNVSFDYKALAARGVHVPWHKVDDTMIAMRLAEPHRGSALKDAATRHVSRAAASSQKDLHKAMRVNKWGWGDIPIDFPPYLFYAAMDVILTARLRDTKVCQEGMASPLYRLEMDVREVCTIMESRGMRVDVEFCFTQRAELEAEIRSIKDHVQGEWGFSLSSNADLGSWLVHAGVPLTRLTPGGVPSVSREALEELLPVVNGTPHTIIQNALRVRKIQKLASSYYDNFINLSTGGLLHPQIETIQAKTGRMSIRNPAMQTLPRASDPDAKQVRRAVIPRNEGEVLISCDYEQIELRCIAAFCGDADMQGAFHAADASGSDFFTEAMKVVYDDQSLDKTDYRRNGIKTLFYAACPSVDTQVLCDDLIWRPAGDLVVGQGLWSFDEFLSDHKHPRARARRWRHAEVTSTDIIERPSVRITLASGRELVCAQDHHWLVQHATHSRSTAWKQSSDLRPGQDALPRYVEPWRLDRSYEAGWLAGIFDGEGCINNCRWRISQLPGPVSDQIEKTLRHFGASFSLSNHPTSGVNNYMPVKDRLYDDLRLLGSVQPTRLIRNLNLDGRMMWRLPEDRGGKDVVVSVEPIGMHPTVTLQTSTHTYLAEGYGAHNSYGAGVNKMAATAGMTIDEMRGISEAVFSRFPGVKSLMRACERAAATNNNWIVTPAGRRIWIDPEFGYKAMNGLIQGHAADVFKQALVHMAQAGLEDMMVVPVHDEILLSVPWDAVEDVQHIVRTCMTDTESAVPLLAEPSQGALTWGDAK